MFITYVSTHDPIVDIFTKGIAIDKFQQFQTMLGLDTPLTNEIRGGYYFFHYSLSGHIGIYDFNF